MSEEQATTPEEMKAILADQDADWGKAEKAEDFSRVPEGRYQAQVVSAIVSKAKTSGNPILKWRLRVYGGSKSIGATIWNDQSLMPKSFSYVKRDLEKAGMTIDHLPDLVDRAPELIGTKWQVKVVYNDQGEKQFTNVYLERFLGKGAVPDATGLDVTSLGSADGGAAQAEAADSFLSNSGGNDGLEF